MLQKFMVHKEKSEKLNRKLSSIRKSLPYEDQDPKKNRILGIEQMQAIHEHLLSQGIGPDVLSPYRTILNALEGLETGRRSTLLKQRKPVIQDRDMMFYAMSAASFDFLRKSEKLQANEAAGQILKIMKKYGLPKLREQSTNSSGSLYRNSSDQRSSKIQLAEWAKACRNGKKGKQAKETYLHTLDAFKHRLSFAKSDALQIINEHFEITTLFKDEDPYRVK